jgi:hypothetical protein
MYPNWDFWFENKPSGSPAGKLGESFEWSSSFICHSAIEADSYAITTKTVTCTTASDLRKDLSHLELGIVDQLRPAETELRT